MKVSDAEINSFITQLDPGAHQNYVTSQLDRNKAERDLAKLRSLPDREEFNKLVARVKDLEQEVADLTAPKRGKRKSNA